MTSMLVTIREIDALRTDLADVRAELDNVFVLLRLSTSFSEVVAYRMADYRAERDTGLEQLAAVCDENAGLRDEVRLLESERDNALLRVDSIITGESPDAGLPLYFSRCDCGAEFTIPDDGDGELNDVNRDAITDWDDAHADCEVES